MRRLTAICIAACALLLQGAAPAGRAGAQLRPWTEGLPACAAPDTRPEPCFPNLALSRDGTRIAVGAPGLVTVWSREDRRRLWTFQEPPNPLFASRAAMDVAFSDDGLWLAVGDGPVLRRLLDATNGRQVFELRDGLFLPPPLRTADGRSLVVENIECERDIYQVELDPRGRALPAIGPVDRAAGRDYTQSREARPPACQRPELVGPREISLAHDIAVWERVGPWPSRALEVYARGRATPLWTRSTANVGGLNHLSRDGSRLLTLDSRLDAANRIVGQTLAVVDSRTGRPVVEIGDCRYARLVARRGDQGFVVSCWTLEDPLAHVVALDPAPSRWTTRQEDAWRAHALFGSPDGSVVLAHEIETWPKADGTVRFGRTRLRLADAATGQTLGVAPLGRYDGPLDDRDVALSDAGRVVLFDAGRGPMLWTPLSGPGGPPS
ncbi:hypothetical protein [Phenylobacterium sp.]|uniref:hypothetical protein n=1 Tax=Phenylobacterium sp. TaxID=1871053 RepID=UPI0035B48C95